MINCGMHLLDKSQECPHIHSTFNGVTLNIQLILVKTPCTHLVIGNFAE